MFFCEIQTKTSIYTGVCWNSDNKKWRVYLKHNGKRYHGGYFDNEKHAAMRVNLLCDEHGIIRKNLTIDEETDVIQKVIYTLFIIHEKNKVNKLRYSLKRVFSKFCVRAVGQKKILVFSKKSIL
jgi:hypothetical protein